MHTQNEGIEAGAAPRAGVSLHPLKSRKGFYHRSLFPDMGKLR